MLGPRSKKVASKPGLGCCAHAAASNATGSTPLTASLAWRPLGIGGVNALASCVLTLRGAVAYSREVFSTWLISNPSRLVLGKVNEPYPFFSSSEAQLPLPQQVDPIPITH